VDHTKRRIEITVEKHRLVVLNRRNHSAVAWCEICEAQVQMVTPDEAAQLCQISTRTIYRWIETDRVHFTETEKGFSLVCLHSLEGDSNKGRPEETVGRRGLFRTRVQRLLKRG